VAPEVSVRLKVKEYLASNVAVLSSYSLVNRDTATYFQRVTSVIIGPNCCGKTSLI
jgi:ABC-type cobalamin/Fe3+-siderophores transport system ATPase subunit